MELQGSVCPSLNPLFVCACLLCACVWYVCVCVLILCLAICVCRRQLITGNVHLTFDVVKRVSSFINSCDFFSHQGAYFHF